MSSRPSMGVPQRQPPSRSVSSSGSLSQRPPHQRSLSSQYLPPSPVRATPGEFPVDANAAAANQNANVTQTQFGTPRRGGSRLRLELANDGITHTGFIGSPTPTGLLDPSRPFPPTTSAAASTSSSSSSSTAAAASRGIPPSAAEAPDFSDVSSPRASRVAQMVDMDNAPLPMPRRRCRFVLPDTKKSVPAPAPAPPKKDNRPKPYSIEVPAVTPRYLLLGAGGKDPQPRSGTANQPPTGYADFNPWTGGGPEDHFTQSFIQNGYFDKVTVGQAETGSAKGAVFPSLKHKTGLYALSTVFSGLLASRRHNGQITSQSTFKAPPRMTLTDAKKESWLKDLANPTTSLRKLGRTVPHGIRGKVLLDQCLNKNVPTDRAVWLAKCVGANETRSFKRKGVNAAVVMSGETKWIRDWTVQIEQFVDGVVASFGDSDWKNKVNYAVRFATHLYAEHLLDREHYIEWLVSGLENCSHAKLPMHLLIIQIYWKDLLRLRKHGRRLVAALLSQYTTIHSHPDRDIFAPLCSRLLLLIKFTMTSCAVNFISPTTWPKHRDALATAFPADDEIIQAAYRAINCRNEQLLSSVRAPPAARHTLVKLLDGTLHAPFCDDLPSRCWATSKDHGSVVKTTLEWCTSLHRPGTAKVFVTHRLLSTWANLGLDTTGAILDFLVSDPLQERDRKTTLYHLVSELVASGHFNPMRYIQWLIARGGLHDAKSVEEDGPAISRLLVELPVSALADSLKTMRANMLGRASYDVDFEATDIEVAIDCVKGSLGLHWSTTLQNSGVPVDKLCKRIRKTSRAYKSAIGQCLRQVIVLEMEQAQNAGKEGVPFPTSTFLAVRSILEAADDFQTLAAFLQTASGLLDANILSSCADILNLYLPAFGAIGIAKDLFATLVDKLGQLTQAQGIVGVRPLLTSMAMLAPRVPGQEALVNNLNDTIRNDRTTAVDASSPVSDSMAARIQDEEGELLDEIEKRLANKTSMDRATMNSFLDKIIPKVQACWAKADERLRAYGSLLARLRHFDTQHFDSFMTKWVLGIRHPQSRPPLAQIFPLMVIVGCLNFAVILATVGDAVSAAGRTKMNARPGVRPSTYVQEVLDLLMTPPAPRDQLLTPEELYQFQVLQDQVPRAHLKETVVLVRNALMEYCASGEPPDVPLADKRVRKRLNGLLRTLVLTDQLAVPKLLAPKTANPAVDKMMDEITTNLLFPQEAAESQFAFEHVLGQTNEFTLPFCHLKLVRCMALVETSGASPQERLQTQLEVYAKAMDDAIESRNITWTGILPWLTPEISQYLLNRAQTKLFDLLPSTKNPTTTEGGFAMAEVLLSMIDTILRGPSAGSRISTQLAPATVDRLADLWELLGPGSAPSVKTAVLFNWLPLMLSYLALHAQPPDATNKQNNEVRGRALLVLSGLLQEFEGLSSLAVCDPSIPSNQISHLTQRIFDLALIFVDTLPDDTRQQCVRHLRDALSDSRLRYIFSYVPSPQDSLMLAHKDKPLVPASGQAGQRPRGMGFLGVGSLSQHAWGVPVPVGGLGASGGERLSAFSFRRWEILNEPTTNVGENNTCLSLTLFEAIKLQ